MHLVLSYMFPVFFPLKLMFFVGLGGVNKNRNHLPLAANQFSPFFCQASPVVTGGVCWPPQVTPESHFPIARGRPFTGFLGAFFSAQNLLSKKNTNLYKFGVSDPVIKWGVKKGKYILT